MFFYKCIRIQWVKKKKIKWFFGRKPYRYSESKPITALCDIID